MHRTICLCNAYMCNNCLPRVDLSLNSSLCTSSRICNANICATSSTLRNAPFALWVNSFYSPPAVKVWCKCTFVQWQKCTFPFSDPLMCDALVNCDIVQSVFIATVQHTYSISQIAPESSLLKVCNPRLACWANLVKQLVPSI